MSLAPEVQALLDQVAASKTAADQAVAKLNELDTELAALHAQIAAIEPSAPIDAEDLAAIKDATASLSSAVSEITAALTPAPAAPVVPAAAAWAAAEPSAGATPA